MIVNGINKYVTEMTVTLEIVQGNFVPKARPKQTSIPTTSSTTVFD